MEMPTNGAKGTKGELGGLGQLGDLGLARPLSFVRYCFCDAFTSKQNQTERSESFSGVRG